MIASSEFREEEKKPPLAVPAPMDKEGGKDV